MAIAICIVDEGFGRRYSYSLITFLCICTLCGPQQLGLSSISRNPFLWYYQHRWLDNDVKIQHWLEHSLLYPAETHGYNGFQPVQLDLKWLDIWTVTQEDRICAYVLFSAKWSYRRNGHFLLKHYMFHRHLKIQNYAIMDQKIKIMLKQLSYLIENRSPLP